MTRGAGSVAYAVLAMIGIAGCGPKTDPRIIYPSTPPPHHAEPVNGNGASGWHFDDAAVGALPPGWRIAETRPAGTPAVWAVAVDPTAPSQPNALVITETRNKGGTYNLAIAEGTLFDDLDLTVKVKANTGKEDQGGGPIWRCKDGDNYYICRLNPLESNYRVYKVVDGKRQQLGSADIAAQAGEWYALRVTMIGDRITCYVNGQKLLEAQDGTLPDAGMIGLWSKADAATAFDDISVAKVQ